MVHHPLALLETMEEIVRKAKTFQRERPYPTTVFAASFPQALSRLLFDKPDVEFDVAGAVLAETRFYPCVAAMLIASTMNHSWLARLVAGHRPVVHMVAFFSNARTGRRLSINRGDHLVVVGLLLKDRSLLMYTKDTRSMIFVESGGCVVVVLEDATGRNIVQVSTLP